MLLSFQLEALYLDIHKSNCFEWCIFEIITVLKYKMEPHFFQNYSQTSFYCLLKLTRLKICENYPSSYFSTLPLKGIKLWKSKTKFCYHFLLFQINLSIVCITSWLSLEMVNPPAFNTPLTPHSMKSPLNMENHLTPPLPPSPKLKYTCQILL